MPDTTSQFKASVPLAYIETTIPSGTTIGEYRRSRPQRRSRWHWLRQSFRRDDRARHAISIGAIVVLTLLFVGSAEAHVYWTNNADTTIGRANLDGTGVNQGLIAGGFNSCGVALDGAHVYWTNAGNGTIGRANLDGTGVNQSLIGGATMPCGVAVDADPTGGGQDPGGGGGVITNPPPPIAGGGGVVTDPPAPVDTAAQLPTLGTIKIARRHRRAGVRARVVLGAKRVSLRPGQRLTVRIRLARRAAGFARHGRLATRIRIKSSDAAGNSATRSLTRRLRTPPR